MRYTKRNADQTDFSNYKFKLNINVRNPNKSKKTSTFCLTTDKRYVITKTNTNQTIIITNNINSELIRLLISKAVKWTMTNKSKYEYSLGAKPLIKACNLGLRTIIKDSIEFLSIRGRIIVT